MNAFTLTAIQDSRCSRRQSGGVFQDHIERYLGTLSCHALSDRDMVKLAPKTLRVLDDSTLTVR
jgi:hypothetical protein